MQNLIPTLSVIIPTFNRAHLLPNAIESVLSQGNVELEIIVVDDGSEDDTHHVVKRYDERVRYLFQNHRGLNAARNLALGESHSPYISLLDDDDLWLPGKAEIQIALLEAFPQAAFVFSDFHIFGENRPTTLKGLETWFPQGIDWLTLGEKLLYSGQPVPGYNDFITPCSVFSGNLYEALLFAPYVLPSTTTIRRSALCDSISFPEHNTHCGDWSFFAELSQGHQFLYMDTATALNRSHHDPVRLTRRNPSEKISDHLDMIERIWEKDHIFMASREPAVRNLKSELLAKLSVNLLLEGQRKKAAMVLKLMKYRPLTKHCGRLSALALLANTPGGDRALRFIRFLKRLLLG